MGCFDFTYADNGENIRGRRGYIYLSPQVAEAINLANPVRFSTVDLYGQFSLCIPLNYGARYERKIDIFSLYHLCIQADHDQWTDDAKRFTNLIAHLQFNDEYRSLNDSLRDAGIDYFFKHLKHESHATQIIVPQLANQRQKHLETFDVFQETTPLLISRKKLPVNVSTNLKDMAQAWGYVSTSDPKQGWRPTRDLYCRYVNSNSPKP